MDGLNYLYSQKNVAYVLNKGYDFPRFIFQQKLDSNGCPDRVRIWDKVLLVRVLDTVKQRKVSTFVSKQKVIEAFFEIRKEKAIAEQKSFEALVYIQGWELTIESERKKGVFYKVTLGPKASDVSCTCMDFKKQKEELFQGRGCCKHLYKYLLSVGFKSLRHYVHQYLSQQPEKPLTGKIEVTDKQKVRNKIKDLA